MAGTRTASSFLTICPTTIGTMQFVPTDNMHSVSTNETLRDGMCTGNPSKGLHFFVLIWPHQCTIYFNLF